MLSDAEFTFIAREVKSRSGAHLAKETNAMCETRLAPLARREGFATVSEFLNSARTKQDPKMWSAIADALVHSETRFFRDRDSFKRLKSEILPALSARKADGRVRIWSAGCGTGQEAYSLAMMLDAMRNEGLPPTDLIATDLSERQLDKARAGLFTQFEVQRGLPIRLLIQYFEKTGDLWRISDRLRASTRFEQQNLLMHPGALGCFDLVLCCNVISSFDTATKLATLERIADVMSPGGVLVLGAGETPPDGCDGFAIEDGVLIKRGAAARKAAA